jgi:hypothetical protein
VTAQTRHSAAAAIAHYGRDNSEPTYAESITFTYAGSRVQAPSSQVSFIRAVWLQGTVAPIRFTKSPITATGSSGVETVTQSGLPATLMSGPLGFRVGLGENRYLTCIPSQG